MAERCTDAQLFEQIDRLDEHNVRLLALAMADILYGPDSDSDWGPDTLDALAGLLAANKIGPSL